MENVSPIEVNTLLSLKGLNSKRDGTSSIKYKEAKIEKEIGAGRFLAIFGDDMKIEVSGSREIKVGDRVKVLLPPSFAKGLEGLDGVSTSSVLDSGVQWSGLIPLGFGGRGSMARLEVFVERQSKGLLKKNSPVYFIFSIKTERQGDIQWSIYLKGRQVTLQIYAPLVDHPKENLGFLVEEVEKGLKNQGFVLGGKTTFLNRLFKTPAGFRLNVRG